MYRRRRRPFLIFLLTLVVLALILGGAGFFVVWRTFPDTDGTVRVPGLDGPVEVYRDPMGIPHIYAGTVHDLLMAQGYVHAQDRFWQMEFWRRIGSGRLSEILGDSGLESDRFIRTIGWHRTAAEELAGLDGETRAALEAYAEGVNAYLAQTDVTRLGLEFALLKVQGVDLVIEPWTPLNTLTWAKVMAWDLSGNMNAELLRAFTAVRVGIPDLAALVPPYPDTAPVIVPHPLTAGSLEALPDAALSLHPFGEGDDIGSNNWVVAGSRTETGMPLLSNDPHLGIQMPSIWYEVGLHCEPVSAECPLNVVGSSFAGAPGVIIGHNDRIAWGMTNLGPDVQDLFVERVNPDNPNQYEYQGQWLDMQIIREEIRVAGEDEPVTVFARITRHGPIINDVVGGTEEAWSFGWEPLALSWTALQPGNMMRAVLLLDRAQNWEDFRNALRYFDVPSQNFVYADVEGNIGYQAPGRIPIRAAGNGSMPVPGWTGEFEWVDYIPFDRLPRAYNPPEGYIVTANNAVVAPDYPYFISMDWDPGDRAVRIIELLEGDSTLTVADMQAIQGDSSVVWARPLLPYVQALTSDDPRVSQALLLLQAWDGEASRDSAGAALFESFRIHVLRETFADELGEQLLARSYGTLMTALQGFLPEAGATWFDNRTTAAVESRDDILLSSLGAAVQELSETLGEDMNKWRWGDLHTATFENQSLGQSGIAPIEWLFNRGPVEVDGAIETVNNTGYRLRDPFAVGVVPSYRQVIDLADLTRSVSVHTTGQSGHPFHPHYADMIDLWRNIEYHPMLWLRGDVEASARDHLTLMP